tara:strand:+ start:1058 stop:1924 length:867 start_codon:yes stop_codon:yes gene_type:complete
MHRKAKGRNRYKMKGHTLPGINQRSETVNLKDGRSPSSAFQMQSPFKEEEDPEDIVLDDKDIISSEDVDDSGDIKIKGDLDAGDLDWLERKESDFDPYAPVSKKEGQKGLDFLTQEAVKTKFIKDPVTGKMKLVRKGGPNDPDSPDYRGKKKLNLPTTEDQTTTEEESEKKLPWEEGYDPSQDAHFTEEELEENAFFKEHGYWPDEETEEQRIAREGGGETETSDDSEVEEQNISDLSAGATTDDWGAKSEGGYSMNDLVAMRKKARQDGDKELEEEIQIAINKGYGL